MHYRRKILAAVGIAAGASLLATAAPAGAQSPPPGTGTSSSSQSLLSVSLGELLDLAVLEETATAVTQDSQKALSAINGLRISSAAIPALNVNLASVLAELPGGNPSDSESLDLSNAAGGLLPGLPIDALLDAAPGVVGGDVLGMQVGAALDTLLANATGEAGLVNLDILGGLLNVVGVESLLNQGSDAGVASVSRALNVDAIALLSLGDLLNLLGLPLTDLDLGTLTDLVEGLGVPVAGLPTGVSLDSFVGDLLDTLTVATGQVDAIINTLDPVVQGLLGGLASATGGSFNTSDTVGSISSLTAIVETLQDQITGLLEGVLGDLDDLSLLKLNALQIGANAVATDSLAGSSANSNCGLGSVQVGLLPAIDLSAVNGALAGLDSVLQPIFAQLPLGLGNVLNLSVCGNTILGAGGATGGGQSVTQSGSTITSSAATSALALSLNPGAVLDAIGGLGLPIGDLFGETGGLGLGNLPALGSVLQGAELGDLLGGVESVLTQGFEVKAASVDATVTHLAGNAATPTARQASGELPRTGNDALPGLLLAGAAIPAFMAARRLMRRADSTV